MGEFIPCILLSLLIVILYHDLLLDHNKLKSYLSIQTPTAMSTSMADAVARNGMKELFFLKQQV